MTARARVRSAALLVAVAVSATLALSSVRLDAADEVVAFVGVTVHDGAGGDPSRATVVVRDGKIAALAKGADAVPAGARRFAVEGAVLTPGLIDAATGTGAPGLRTEVTREMTAHVDVTDQVDPRATDLRDAAQAGVTTVCVTTGTTNVVGGLARVFHTRTARGRAEPVKDAARPLHIALSGDPSRGNFPPRRGPTTSIYARRPTTRMGVVWMLRQVFLAAKGEQELPNEVDLAPYREVLAGKRPLHVQLNRNQDIVAALRIADEVGFTPVFEGAEEAYLSREELGRRKLAVILGQQPHVRTGQGPDFTETALASARLLRASGVRVALSAGTDGARRLRDQVVFARRYGLAAKDALAAVTSVPAGLLGLADRGVVAQGKAADLVLWSGDPLSPATRPLVVMVDGRIVHRDGDVE